MKKTRIISEIAQAHDGSLGIAYSMVSESVKAGCTDIKFQIHFADEESTPTDQFRVNIFPQDQNRFDYWKRIQFSTEQWCKLIDYTGSLGVGVIVSPFSVKALDICSICNVKTIKIGSGEIYNEQLIDRLDSRFTDVILSNGMCTITDLKSITKRLMSQGLSVSLLECISKYPTKLSEVNLQNIPYLREIFGLPVGLSDHTGKLVSSLAAVIRYQAEIIEVHTTFSRNLFGPDATSSITFDDLRVLSTLLSEYFELGSSIEKNLLEINSSQMQMVRLFGRSIVLNTDLLAGETIQPEHLSFKKPGGGLSWNERFKLEGKTLKQSLNANSQISLDDVL
ncbi:N-acetylneuraminate synthase family protein [Synechococcus sp. UW140]|uniref:N-acetylneuraminate synthase family protein n=1 Tax=Synechococcus sp. UW140 TaxID=368503 RepID=UPI00313786D5